MHQGGRPPFLVPPPASVNRACTSSLCPTPLCHTSHSSEASPGDPRLSHAGSSLEHRLLCAHPQVRDGLQDLRDKRERVFQAWEQKQERLQAVGREQLFLKKCGRLDEILKAWEAGALTPEPP